MRKDNRIIINRNFFLDSIGWGRIAFDAELSDVLQEVVIPVWEQSQCVAAFSQPIYKTNLCAGSYEGGKDSCSVSDGPSFFFLLFV